MMDQPGRAIFCFKVKDVFEILPVLINKIQEKKFHCFFGLCLLDKQQTKRSISFINFER